MSINLDLHKHTNEDRFEPALKKFQDSEEYLNLVNILEEYESKFTKLIVFNHDYGDRVRPCVVALHSNYPTYHFYELNEEKSHLAIKRAD